MRVAKTIELDAQTDRELRVLSQRNRIKVRLQQRARIVLLAAKGMQNKEIPFEAGLGRWQVARWRTCDEKSQIQALNLTPPGLPMKAGRDGTMTHDYKRHGTTTLFAALNSLEGSVISMCQSRRRHTGAPFSSAGPNVGSDLTGA